MSSLPQPRHMSLTQAIPTALFDFIYFTFLLVQFSIEAFFILHQKNLMFHLIWLANIIFFIILKSHFTKPQPTYLVDFSCLKPPSTCKVPFSTFFEHMKKVDFWDEKSQSFMTKVLQSSGQGQETYLPPAIHQIPPKSDHQEAIKEAQMVLFPVFEDLLGKTNLHPHEIDILIVNCSGFCPNPSLSSMIINRYSMREDVKVYNISGMGCSASALCIDMAHTLFKVHNNSNAVIISTEILSTGWYAGKEPAMMVLNCLFRMGGAAILLSNKKEVKRVSKYRLLRSLRTQRAFDDKAYYSAIREEDGKGITGVTLKRDLLVVAGETLRSNITLLGLSVLPVTEIVHYMVSVLRKRFAPKSYDIYVPNFRSVIRHFCLPTSGRPVIREIAKGLKLSEREMEPAIMTLHRFGNQSSSSLWYELAYMEGKERVKKGDKVWQLGMGSGPKCTSLVWECVRPIRGEAQKGPWDDSIDSYPNIAFVK